MDISSSSSFKQSISSNPEGVKGKDLPKERIQSVKPEIESLGAVGGEGVFDVSYTERSAETVSDTNLDIVSVKEKSHKRFYGTHPISPVTEFTENYLEGIVNKSMKVALLLKTKQECVVVKMAALRVQTLIIKMIRGEDTDKDIAPLIKRINALNKVTNLKHENFLPRTDSYSLWPIDIEYCRNDFFVNQGEEQERLHIDSVKVYFESLIGYKFHGEAVLTAKEKSDFVADVIGCLKVIKHDGEEEEKLRATAIDKDEKQEIGKDSYYFLSEEYIESIDTSNPGLRSVAEKYNCFILPKGLVEISNVEQKLLACYNLCSGYSCESVDTVLNVKPLFFLESYKELLKDDLSSGKLTVFEAQQIACLWMKVLSEYFRFYLHISMLGSASGSAGSKTNDFTRMGFVGGGKATISNNEVNLCSKKCLYLTMWAKENGFFNLATHQTLQRLLVCTLSVSKKINAPSLIGEFAMDIADHSICAAIGDIQKQESYLNYMAVCELVGDKEKFDKVSEIALQFSFLPLMKEIWNDLGVSANNNPWGTIKKLRPEYVIQYLIKMVEEKEILVLMKEEMESLAKNFHAHYKANTMGSISWEPSVVLYLYITDQEDAGKALLQYVESQWHKAFVSLAFVSKKEFKNAIGSIKDCLAEWAKGPIKFKAIKNNMLAFLALVYKRLADTVSGDEKIEYLEQALLHLKSPALTNKELFLSVAIIQEQLNYIRSAYNSYSMLEEHCKTFPEESAENCQLHFISQAKERLREMMIESSKNESLEEIHLQKSTKQSKKQRQRQRERQRQNQKKLSEILTTKTDPRLTSIGKEITLPAASLRMAEASEIDIEIKEPVECIYGLALQSKECTQKDNDTNWEVVGRKKTVSHLNISYDISNEAVELAMSSTKYSRFCLYRELLDSANIDYDGLFNRHDKLYDEVENIILKQVIFQNKMWSIRHKTFNLIALDYEFRQTHIPVYQIKATLRRKIVDSLYSNIEYVIKRLTSETLPTTWRKNPESIFACEKVAAIFSDKNTALRFSRQFGAQCSTMAHVMRDVFCDVPRNAESMEYVSDTFGITKLSELNDLSKLFYNCRNRIDPGHATRSID